MNYLGDSKEILEMLHTADEWKDTTIVYVSRTTYPEDANELLTYMNVTETETMSDVCVMDWNQIYPANKTVHFGKLAKDSGIPLNEMLFFDNQMDNIESVAPMGVTSIYTPNGMTKKHMQEGLRAYARTRGK